MPPSERLSRRNGSASCVDGATSSVWCFGSNVAFGFLPHSRPAAVWEAPVYLTMSLSGARATWANYTLDGIANTDIDFNTYILLPSVEALQEFKVQSGVYPRVRPRSRPGKRLHETGHERVRGRSSNFCATTRWTPGPMTSTRAREARPIHRPKACPIGRTNTASPWEARLRSRNSTTGETTSSSCPTLKLPVAPGNHVVRHHDDCGHAKGDFSAIPTILQDPSRGSTPPNVTTSPYPGSPEESDSRGPHRQDFPLPDPCQRRVDGVLVIPVRTPATRVVRNGKNSLGRGKSCRCGPRNLIPLTPWIRRCRNVWRRSEPRERIL